ncbi:glycoside hydrolase family 9 protein [Micromonospora radicis]|nr:glycoside hydrolase family 9 protein [Micromonospora radicis]
MAIVLLVTAFARPVDAQSVERCQLSESSFSKGPSAPGDAALRIGCARDAGRFGALADRGDDIVAIMEFTPSREEEELQETLQRLVDDAQRMRDSGRTLGDFFERQANAYGIDFFAEQTENVDFDGAIHRVDNHIVIVVPQAEIEAAWNWIAMLKKIALAIIFIGTWALVEGVCLATFAPGAALAAPVCGAIGGFIAGGSRELLAARFDNKPINGEVWSNALGTALGSALSGAVLSVAVERVAELAGNSFAGIQRYLRDLALKLWSVLTSPIRYVADLFTPRTAQIMRNAFEMEARRRIGATATGACPAPTGANVEREKWTEIGRLQDNILRLLRLLAGGTSGTTATEVRFADIDGDGLADRLLVAAAGRAEVSQNVGCDDDGKRIWSPRSDTGPIAETLERLRATQIHFGDLDGDDRADYIAVLDAAQSSTGAPSIQAWRNDSSIQEIRWAQGSRIANNLGYVDSDRRLFVDIDGDGDDDYLTITADNTVTAWENTARGFPGPGDWRRFDGFGHPGQGQPGKKVHFADITGDGRADVLLADDATGDVQAWENVGGPWTRTAGWRSLGVIQAGSPLAGRTGAIFSDLDGDRVADLMLYDQTAGIDAWRLPRYGAGPQGPGQPGTPGFPTQLPAGTLPAYGGGEPRPQVTGRLIQNSNFTGDFKPWWVNAGMTPKVDGGVFCVTAPASAKPWDVIVGHNSIYLPRGKSYTFRFRVRTSQTVNLTVQVAPFYNPNNTTYLVKYPTVTGGAWRQYEYTFDTGFSADYMLSQVQFRLGGADKSYEFCMDDVTLNGDSYVYRADRGPAVKVNQHGYLPRGPKRATLVSAATSPQSWTLRRVGGGTVATGQSRPAGYDGSAGANVHLIDFSSVTATGRFELVVGGQASYPFDIRTDLYASLRTDSMRFFYPNRSGIAIDGGIAGAEYARPAGHVASSPNGGDTRVPCQTPQPFMDNWTCDYTLDVTGGWYDAGDHGKYVVNGGIATYQLLSAWERAVAVGRPGPLGDATLAVPERGNGVPDILDEARWNLEFMLKMQVPAGKPLAGMVHHKVHDESWTGPPMLPHQDRKQRELHRPSTAATLNLAAVAAQGARLYAPYDAAFAARLRAAAERAYAAALANPALYAPRADRSGGGPYADDDVTDEFYWAATQLYLTTGGTSYLNALRANRYHRAGVAFDQNGFYWGSVAALAQLDLARFGSGLSEQAQIRGWVTEAASRLVSFQRAERFGQSYTPTSGMYDWGSNASILNNQVVLATAYDLTGNTMYADAVFEAFDYLLGRNALGQSYVTGYGTKDAKNQHSRWYAKSFDATLPNPPVGSVSGGPNSSLQDPLAASWLHGCAPQLCYVDNLEAWSVNEITINWNSALAWVSAFAADVAPRR